MLKLAFRNVVRHKGRTALTLCAIAFGVAGLLLSGGFVNDILAQLREATIHSGVGHVQIYKAGYLSRGKREPHGFMIEDPQRLVDGLSAYAHVQDVMMRMQVQGLLSTGRGDMPVLGEGIEPEKEARLGTFVTTLAGRRLEASDHFGIVLGEGLARGLDVGPGDYVTLLADTAGGALNSAEFEVVGVFRTFSKEYDARAARVPLVAAQELMLAPGVHSLVLALDRTESTAGVAQELERKLATEDLEIRTWDELSDFYGKAVALYRRQFGVLQMIILVMVALSVTNSVNMAVFERIGEFGTLMALGDRRRDVFRLVMKENVLLGLIGAVLGIGMGIALAFAISAVGIPMPPPPSSNSGYTAAIRLAPALVSIGFIVGFGATVLAAVLPARRVSGIHVSEALRHHI